MKNDNTFWGLSHTSKKENKSTSDYLVIADDLPVLLCRFKKDGSIFFVNKFYSKFFNASRESLIGTKFILSPSEFKNFESVKPFLNFYKKELSLTLNNNSIHQIEWTISRIKSNDSDEYDYQAIGQDISHHKLLEEHLEKISVAVEQSKSTVVITDTNGNIEYVNPRFTDITGYTIEEAIGKNTRILKSNKNDERIYTDLWKTISSGKEWQG